MKTFIFTKTIFKKEKLTQKNKQTILKSCEKNIYVPIKGDDLPINSRLLKNYLSLLVKDMKNGEFEKISY